MEPAGNWQHIQELFHAAADLPPAEQGRYLDRACGGNAELRAEVASLLAADQSDGKRVATALEETARSLLDAVPMVGARFGPWRVVREIGSGGMGSVYLVVRDDGFHQHAALKLIKRGLDTAELLARFRRERQILANLDHPYIARLLDGGSTPEGRPYFVMEYVEGRTMADWVREAGPPVEERCRFFVKVCEAVACAHRNLVVHRDLKPGNIMVTPDGAPKLLDFGIARLLAPDAKGSTMETTLAHQPLTPEYASPEQVAGAPVTTATDVYSLGAILYELLSGAKAHRLKGTSAAEVQLAVCRTPLERPSVAVAATAPGAPRLRRQIAGDLDNIVLMAMRKEPERRYSSVEQFAEDIGRYLDGQPVIARKDSLRYRGGKFIRRHRWALSAAAVSALSLVAGTVLAVSEAEREAAARLVAESQRAVAETARQSAEREHAAADQARATAESEAFVARSEQHRAEQRLKEMVDLANHSLFDIHSQIEGLPGATEARRKIVGTTLQYLEELEKDAQDDERLRMTVAVGYLKLAGLQGNPNGPSLRDYPGALKSYQKAEALLAPLCRAHPKDAEPLAAWIEVRFGAGQVLTVNGGAAEAVGYLEAALAPARTLARLHPNDPVSGRREPLLDGAIAWALDERDTSAALGWARKGLAGTITLAHRFPNDETITQMLSDAHSDVARFLCTLGEMQPCLAEYEMATPIRERLLAASPNDVARRRSLMLAYGHIASIQGDPFRGNLGDFEGARQNYAKAVAIAEQTAREDPRNRTAQYDLASALLRLGAVDGPPSGLADALGELERAAAVLDKLLAASPDDLIARRNWELAQEYLGNRLRGLGRLPEALGAYRRSLESANSTLAKQPGDRTALSQSIASGSALALTLAMGGDRAGALAQARDTVERARAGTSIPSDKEIRIIIVSRSLMGQGSVYRVFAEAEKDSPAQSQADWREARAAAERALTEAAAVPGADKNLHYAKTLEDARELVADADKHLRSASRLPGD